MPLMKNSTKRTVGKSKAKVVVELKKLCVLVPLCEKLGLRSQVLGFS